YLHIDTGGSDDTPDGGIMMRKEPQQQGITNYVKVDSVSDSARQVERLGGKVCMGKTAVPNMGWFAVCQDPEKNTFGLWEIDRNAK
ncbi:MAG: VOC family protein, partial [Verrucomicrobiota bacterium]|nr:VOC family protein [Verrucomicrobiota bacterium]